MMLTRKPMKRTGFKRTEREDKPKPCALLNPIRQGVQFGQPAKLPIETEKFEYVRSKELLEACRAIPCQACGISDGTVVAAHSNQIRHGKSRGKKASDVYVASLCFVCHSELDQGRKMSREERNLMWYLAHLKTKTELCSSGLWPADVPVPEENYDYD